MIGHRIKPKMRPGPARAKALAGYAQGRSANKQIQLVQREIGVVKKYVEAIKSNDKRDAVELKNCTEYLDVLQRSLRSLERANGIEVANLMAGRGAALAEYATRMDEQLEALPVTVCGIRGISTGETFYSGVMSPHTADSEFEHYSLQAKRGGHPIEHIVYSWQADENPNNKTAIAAANFALQKAGFPDACPRMIGVHRDTDNLHVHVVLSRYMPQTDRVWSCKSLLDKIHHGCREAEIEFGFKHDNGNYVVQVVDGEKKIVAQPFKFSNLSDSAKTVENRHGTVSLERFARDFRPLIETLLANSSSWQELHQSLASELGIGIKRHGKGYVITDLSGEKNINTKASFGGLGAPTVEAKLGNWTAATSMSALRKKARACAYSYTKTTSANAPSETPVAAINAAISTEKQDAIELLKNEMKSRFSELNDRFKQTNKPKKEAQNYERSNVTREQQERNGRKYFVHRIDAGKLDSFAAFRQPTSHSLRTVPSRSVAASSNRRPESLLQNHVSVRRGRPGELRRPVDSERASIERQRLTHEYKRRLAEIRQSHAPLRERTAVEKKQLGAVPQDRASDNAVSSHVMRIRAVIVIVRLPGYHTREAVGGGVEYLAGGVRVLHDNGRRIEVCSNVKNHIRDGIELLLKRDPAARERGITITGTPEFRRQTLKVLAEMGLKPAYAGAAAQAEFETYKEAVAAMQAGRARVGLGSADPESPSRGEVEQSMTDDIQADDFDSPEIQFDDIDLSDVEQWDGDMDRYRHTADEQLDGDWTHEPEPNRRSGPRLR